MVFDIQTILIIALLLLNLIIGALLLRTELRLRKLFRGKESQSLEDLIQTIHKDTEDLRTFQKESITGMKILNERLAKSIRGVGLIRFNPFKGKGYGGDQSFASAFLNDDGDGIVLSSIYSRDRVSTYAKPVKHFESTYDLSSEEKQIISNIQKEL
tara:strand:+ start:38 stop:505 length:468 start_codon:yes stop_codon:yes gene_type:complete